MRKKWSELAATLTPGTPEAKDAQRRSMAYKVAANSFYGVVGSPYSRYFDRQVAESVTQNGVWLIKRTISEAVERGMDVVYGDTDSFFAMKTTQAAFQTFCDWCNADLYPKLLREVGCDLQWNKIKLAYEKAFAILLMVSKKRYAGLFLHYKGAVAKPMPDEGQPFDKDHSRPEIKGLEYKRGDAAVLARRLQERVIMTAMRGVTRPEAYRKIVDEALAHVQAGELPLEEVQLSKSLSKPTKDYHRKHPATGADVAVPPHVKVAEAMAKAGKEIGEGSRVAYVVVDGYDGIKAISAADYVGELDRYYLWDNLVYPPTMRVLQAAFPDQDWVAGLERTRPRKQRRGLPAQVPEEQGRLFEEIPARARAVPELTPPGELSSWRVGPDTTIARIRMVDLGGGVEGVVTGVVYEAAASDHDVMAEAFARSFEWEVLWRG
jgi:DNA polymerase elongation subunit (family B)